MADYIFEEFKIFSSEKAAIDMIEPILSNLRTKVEIPDERFYNIMIAVTEAVNNAITHGNSGDPAKKVEFSIKADRNFVEISVKDEGTGFDPDNVEDCLHPENLLKSHGRGIFIIRELMHSAEFIIGNDGTKVVMKYKINH